MNSSSRPLEIIWQLQRLKPRDVGICGRPHVRTAAAAEASKLLPAQHRPRPSCSTVATAPCPQPPLLPQATRLQRTHKTHRCQHATAGKGLGAGGTGSLPALLQPGRTQALGGGSGSMRPPPVQNTQRQPRHAHLQSNGGQF